MERLKRIYKAAMARMGAIPADKVLHFAVGMIITLLLGAALPEIENYAVAGAVIAGIAKEIIDKRDYGRYDWRDMVATIAGGAVVQVLLWL